MSAKEKSEDTRTQLPFLIWYPYDWIVAAYVLLVLVLALGFRLRLDFSTVIDFRYDAPFLGLMILYMVIVLSIEAFRLRREQKDSFVFGTAWRHYLRRRYLNWRRLAEILRTLIVLKLVLLIYCNIKQAIPFINGHLYDEQLLRLDTIFHFGVNPNLLLVRLCGDNMISFFFDGCYAAWYVIKPFVLAYFLAVAGFELRSRFFGAYFSMWIVGGIMALLLPSLGPIYVKPEWFESLNCPLASFLQQMLITHYRQALADPGSYRVFIYEGIAAFPSLHVGIVALFSFFLFERVAVAGWLMCGYTVIVLLGSVLLGWHYAVDGYVAILMAFLLFRYSRRLFCFSSGRDFIGNVTGQKQISPEK